MSCSTPPQAELWLSPPLNSSCPAAAGSWRGCLLQSSQQQEHQNRVTGARARGGTVGMRNRAQGKPGGAGQYRRPVPNLQNTPKDARDGNGYSRDHLMRGTGRQGLCRETGHRSAGRGDVSLHKADKWLDRCGVPRILSSVGWSMVLVTPRVWDHPLNGPVT